MKTFIFRVEVEVLPMAGTQLPDDVAGAFVNCYLGADNIREAIDLVEAQLLEDCYKPFQTLAAFSLDLDAVDYDTDEEGLPGNEELLSLQKNGGIWYGSFNAYLPEEGGVH